MTRRDILLAAAQAQTSGKLLMPSDIPDEVGFRTMWYNPIPPIDITKWSLEIKGLVEKPQALKLAQLRALPQVQQNSRMKDRKSVV